MPMIPLERCGRPFAYLDPASGRKQARRPGARSAFIVACLAPPAYILVLYAWAQRASTTEIIAQTFLIHETYHPVQIAVETAGQQYLLYSAIQTEAQRLAIRLPLVEGTQYTEDTKDQRIKDCIEPLTAQGRLCIQSHQIELRQELTDYPHGATKDLLDALSGCVNLIPRPVTTAHAQDTRQSVLDYLHRRHVTDADAYLARLGQP